MRWRVYRLMLNNQRWDVLSGWDVQNGCGRCSTPVTWFDPAAATAVTRSGRVYRLEGEPGDNDDARYVFVSRYGSVVCEGLRMIDATNEYRQSIADRLDFDVLPMGGESRGLRAIARKADVVFGDSSKAARWLRSYSPVLAATPISLTGSKAGRRLVHDELSRIDMGNFS
jgi:hypothetical protein